MVKRLHFLLLLCIMTSFIACKKNNSSETDSNSAMGAKVVDAKDGELVCTIDGKEWRANNIKAQYLEEPGGVIRPIIHATAKNDSINTVLSIQLRNVKEAGTYPFDHKGFKEPHATATYVEFKKGGRKAFRKYLEGSVELRTFDQTNHVISGSFDFKLKEDGSETNSAHFAGGNFKHLKMEKLDIKRQEPTPEQKELLEKKRKEIEAAKEAAETSK